MAINLGNVVGLLKSLTAPIKRYILWAWPFGTNPDAFFVYYYNFVSASWERFDISSGYVLPSVIEAPRSSPPVTPVVGGYYLTTTSSTGAWSGHNNELALWTGVTDGWSFNPIKDGAVANHKSNYLLAYQLIGISWIIRLTGFNPNDIQTYLRLTGATTNETWVGRTHQSLAGGLDSNTEYGEDYIRMMSGKLTPDVRQVYLLLQRIEGGEIAELTVATPANTNFIQLHPTFGWVGKKLQYFEPPALSDPLDIPNMGFITGLKQTFIITCDGSTSSYSFFHGFDHYSFQIGLKASYDGVKYTPQPIDNIELTNSNNILVNLVDFSDGLVYILTLG